VVKVVPIFNPPNPSSRGHFYPSKEKFHAYRYKFISDAMKGDNHRT